MSARGQITLESLPDPKVPVKVQILSNQKESEPPLCIFTDRHTMFQGQAKVLGLVPSETLLVMGPLRIQQGGLCHSKGQADGLKPNNDGVKKQPFGKGGRLLG